MNASQMYIIILLILIFFVGFLFSRKKGHIFKRLSPIASLAFIFVLAGIVFGENRLVGYSLLGIGVILSIIDIYMKR